MVEEAAVEVAVGAAGEDEGRRKFPSTRRSDQAENRRGVIVGTYTKSMLLAEMSLASVVEDRGRLVL
jgi:hypothetical protein